LGTELTDAFTLSLSYDHDRVIHGELKRGLFGLVSKYANGNWINAVDNNFGGTKKFMDVSWRSGREFGNYGVDP